MLIKINSKTIIKKTENKKEGENPNLNLDSVVYREMDEQDSTEEESQIKIENEKNPVNLEIIESSHSEYLSYKSSNYYEVKNNLRKNAYFKINSQFVITSMPGILDVFGDAETGRVLVKLHLSDTQGNHFFKFFRSNGALPRNLWKYLVVQLSPYMIKIYFNSVLDTQIDLKDYSIIFKKHKKGSKNQEGFAFFKHKNSNEYKHNGVLIGNIDATTKINNFDELKYNPVYDLYHSKSLLDQTNQKFFKKKNKVPSNKSQKTQAPPSRFKHSGWTRRSYLRTKSHLTTPP
jgi:hypothetical protein